jgi:hypothetical protein
MIWIDAISPLQIALQHLFLCPASASTMLAFHGVLGFRWNQPLLIVWILGTRALPMIPFRDNGDATGHRKAMLIDRQTVVSTKPSGSSPKAEPWRFNAI